MKDAAAQRGQATAIRSAPAVDEAAHNSERPAPSSSLLFDLFECARRQRPRSPDHLANRFENKAMKLFLAATIRSCSGREEQERKESVCVRALLGWTKPRVGGCLASVVEGAAEQTSYPYRRKSN